MLLQKPALDWHGPDADDGSGAQDSGPEIFAGLATRTNNLPSSLSSFVGRAEHAALVRRLVSSHRLVTLAGAGGIGKTRLATEPPGGLVATFEDGVWLVELAGLSRGRSSAGCGGGARRPRAARPPPLRNLVQAFWDRSVLVVLDNCEYLLERCAELAEAVGRDCPLVRFVATSREPLGVEGEHVWRVPSLSVPISDGKEDLEELAGFTSIELFVARARPTSTTSTLTAPTPASSARSAAASTASP